MAAGSPGLSVSLSPEAIASLDEIWDWNARTYSVEHAERYIAFLNSQTLKLATDYPLGKPVAALPRLRYITIQRRPRGHGHVAVYELMGQIVYILDYFHTAEDWQTKLQEEMP